jgi:hypothetical protein
MPRWDILMHFWDITLCTFGTLPGICDGHRSLQADQKEAELEERQALIRYAVCRVKNRAAQAGAVRHLKAKTKACGECQVDFWQGNHKIKHTASHQPDEGREGRISVAGCQELRKHRLRP